MGARLTEFGLIVSRTPPWARRKYVLKRPAPWTGKRENLSGPQLKACLALARAATASYGKRGKVPYKGVNMPVVAVEVAKAVPKGASVHGGLSRADRARRAHEAASASIASLESILAAKGVGIPA